MKAKKEERNKFRQSSILNFTKKHYTVDTMEKKKIDEAIVKLIVIENDACTTSASSFTSWSQDIFVLRVAHSPTRSKNLQQKQKLT
jgi:hypothetical protein